MAFAAVLGPIIGAASSIFSGIAGMNQARYQQQMAEMQARQNEENARRTLERGAIEAQDQDMQTLQRLGEQEAAQSASGLSLRSGSAILTRKTARELGRRDALNVIQDSRIEAYNFEVAAAGDRATAAMHGASATNSLVGGFLGAAGSLVSMAGPTARSPAAAPNTGTMGSYFSPTIGYGRHTARVA
jgi:hypothetical protein